MIAFVIGKFALCKTARPYSKTSTGWLSGLTPGWWILLLPSVRPYASLRRRVIISRTCTLDSVKVVRFLGITITRNLRWNKYIRDVTRRANQILGLLRRNLYFCDQKTKEAAYAGLVRPILEYACFIWDPYQQDLTQELEKVQRRAIRFVTSDYSNYEEGSATRHMQTLGWKHLKSRREAATTCLFNPKGGRVICTKHLSVPYARTNIYKFSFLPRATRLWNSLPNSLINSNNVETFEATIKEMEFSFSFHALCKHILLYRSHNTL